jgi:hypothetical protein
MANRFLNNITINDEYTLPSADGTADQIITTDGAGQLSFVDQSTINAGNAEHVVIYAKNTSGASISKGTPVYITGTVGATDTVEIAPADASDSAKMPAVGLLDDTLANNAFGYVITGGFMDNITTDPIDGATPSSNDTVYVKSGGGLTLTKPTGSNLIQNVAKVGKVSGGNSGSLIVSSILRTNDVPNLTTGKIWVGTANNTAESTVVHLDETNTRMGIGLTNPSSDLEVQGGTTISAVAFSGPTVKIGDYSGIGNTRIFSNGSYIGYSTANSYHDFSNAGSSQMRITSTGEVGIGTTSPSYKLDVDGEVNSSGVAISDQLILDTTSTYTRFRNPEGSSALYLGDSGDRTNYYDNNTHRFRGSGGSGDKMLINSSGNVGIGTTSPGAKLDVNGGIKIGADSSVFSDGSVTIGIDYNNNQTDRVFNIKKDNSTELFRVQENGNVGIGTTSPTSLLTLESNSSSPYPRIDIKSTSYYPGSEIRFLSSSGSEVSSIESYNNPGIQYLKLQYNASSTGGKVELQDNTAILGAGTSGGQSYLSVGITDARIVTNYSTRMYFNTLGYVGINETSPSARLQVKESSITTFTGTGSSAQLRLRGGYTSNEYIILGFSQDSNKDIGRMAVKRGGSGSSFHWGVSTNYGNGITNEAMILNHQGRLGINNLTPSYLLDVGGDGRVNGTLTCVTLVQTSQRDQKKDIADIDKTKAKAIPFKEYKYKSSIDGSERKRYGVVAEDIENDYPELVHTGADGIKGINYIDLLVKRVAELEKELEDISLTPGPKGDKGDTGAQGPAGANGTNGKDGANGNDHLKNVQSIAFNEKTGQLEITIEGHKDPFKFNPAK